MRRAPLWLAPLAALGGCMGFVRHTTTQEGSTETLLRSQAAQRAVSRYRAEFLGGKRVLIDGTYLRSLDRELILSALRAQVGAAGGIVLRSAAPAAPAAEAPQVDVVIEVRASTMAMHDPAWEFGVPGGLPLPIPLGPPLVPVPQSSPMSIVLPAFTIGFDPQIAWAKLHVWAYDPATSQTLDRQTVWGRGRDDWFHDPYPESELKKALLGEQERAEDEAGGGANPEQPDAGGDARQD